MSSPRLSVALVTRNRPESLERALASLRAQSRQPFEVVVSDDSSEEHVPAVRSCAERLGCVYIQGPRRGLYANRNFSALRCQGTHVRTMDDDHELPPGHWEAVEAAVAADPAAVWSISEFLDPSQVVLPVPPVGEIKPRGFSAPPEDLDASMSIADGASVYPRAVLQAHRMIDCFKFGKSYLEFGARLKALGFRLRHLPTTYILHHAEVGRSFDAAVVDVQTGFLAAALAYGAYFPSFLKSLECWTYFTAVALENSLFRRANTLTLREWRCVLRLFFAFRRAYRLQLAFDDPGMANRGIH